MQRVPLVFAAAVLAATSMVPQESLAKPRGMAAARAIQVGVPMRPVARPLARPRVLPVAAHRTHGIHPAMKPHPKTHSVHHPAQAHAAHPRHDIAAHHHPNHRKFRGAVGFGLPFTAGAGVYYGNPELIELPDLTGSIIADVPDEQSPEQLRRVSIRYGTPSICRSERVRVPSPQGARLVTVTRC